MPTWARIPAIPLRRGPRPVPGVVRDRRAGNGAQVADWYPGGTR